MGFHQASTVWSSPPFFWQLLLERFPTISLKRVVVFLSWQWNKINRRHLNFLLIEQINDPILETLCFIMRNPCNMPFPLKMIWHFRFREVEQFGQIHQALPYVIICSVWIFWLFQHHFWGSSTDGFIGTYSLLSTSPWGLELERSKKISDKEAYRLGSWVLGEHFGTVDLACERMFLGGQNVQLNLIFLFNRGIIMVSAFSALKSYHPSIKDVSQFLSQKLQTIYTFNIAPENRPFAPKGKDRLPTIYFQGLC